MTRAQTKKARAAGEPTDDAYAQCRVSAHFPSAEVMNYLHCFGCASRDLLEVELAKVHAHFERLPLVPFDISDEQIDALVADGRASVLCGRAKAELAQISIAFNGFTMRHHLLDDYVRRADNVLSKTIATLDELDSTRSDVMKQDIHQVCVYEEIHSALPHVPSDVVAIVVAYVDVVQDYVDPEYARLACTVYNQGIACVLKEQCSMSRNIMAALGTGRLNADFDFARRAAMFNVCSVMRAAGLLTTDASFADKVQAAERKMTELFETRHNFSRCQHRPELAALAKLEVPRCRKAVAEEASRMRALGFEVYTDFEPHHFQ